MSVGQDSLAASAYRKGRRGPAGDDRRLRLMLGAQFVWVAVICLLGGWWGRLVFRQSARIAELERMAGLTASASQEQLMRTHRMLFWEGTTYILLLAASSLFLLWLYWRDARRSRGIQAFFASVTHELRTPLTSIRLQAESIADNLSGDSAQKPLLERLMEDTMRLEGQVERTLELARVEGGGPVFTQSVQLKPWVDRLVSSWRDAYGSRAEFDVQVQDVSVEADPAALQVILKNLFENSLRHARKDRVRVSIAARPRDGGIALDFADDGTGFQGDARSLGGLFQKGPGSHGAGVGLYLVRVLMGKMGGTARFEGQGGFRAELWLRETGGQNG